MKTKWPNFGFLLSSFILLVLAGCGAPEHIPTAMPLTGVSVWISAPTDGTAIALGPALNVQARATTTVSTISRFTLFVNGTSIGAGRFSRTSPTDGETNASWTPRAPGEYWLQGQVTLANGHSALSDPVRVCVFNFGASGWEAIHYQGPCQLPTQIPGLQPGPETITLNGLASPNPLSVLLPFGVCQSNLTLTFVAQVSDPADQVGLVYFNIDSIPPSGAILPGYLMNWITTRAGNQKEYRYTIDVTGYGNASPLPHGIHWTMLALTRSNTIAATTSGDVGLVIAQCSAQHLEAATATPTLVPSESTCPPGTYFAPGSQQCVQIQIVTPNPNSGGNNNHQCPAGKKWICTGITNQTCSCQ